MEEKSVKRARDKPSKHGSEGEIASLDELWSKIQGAINESNIRIETKIESCLVRIDEVETQLTAHKADCSQNVKSICASINEVRCELSATNEYVSRFEKSSELIVSGIPYVNEENLKNTFLSIATTLGYTIAPSVDLKRMARAPIKPGESPSIVCQFALRSERDSFYRRYLGQRNLSLSHLGFQSNNRIYVNENLTQLARGVRIEATKLKRLGKIHQVFTRDGVVHIRTSSTSAAIACHSVMALEKLNNPIL